MLSRYSCTAPFVLVVLVVLAVLRPLRPICRRSSAPALRAPGGARARGPESGADARARSTCARASSPRPVAISTDPRFVCTAAASGAQQAPVHPDRADSRADRSRSPCRGDRRAGSAVETLDIKVFNTLRTGTIYLVSARKPPLLHKICDEPPQFRRDFGHATHRTGTTERLLASNRPAFPTSGHRRPFPSRCAERGGRNPQEMAALRQRGVFDVVRPHACAVAQADRCGAGWRPVSTMQRCAQTHRRRGSEPDRDRDAQGC